MKNSIVKVLIFAISFAFVEAAVVVYLRHLLGSTQTVTNEEILFLVPGIAFLEPQTAIKIITNSAILNVERIREAATLVMLAAVATLAGKTPKQTLAYFFLSFGMWDIFYYIFLRLTIGWPTNFGDLDIFFLLPFPWVGPVFVPVLLSFFLVVTTLFYLLRKGNS